MLEDLEQVSCVHILLETNFSAFRLTEKKELVKSIKEHVYLNVPWIECLRALVEHKKEGKSRKKHLLKSYRVKERHTNVNLDDRLSMRGSLRKSLKSGLGSRTSDIQKKGLNDGKVVKKRNNNEFSNIPKRIYSVIGKRQ